MAAEAENVIRVFPLASVLLLPGTYLPLNIFEPRYRAMVAEALADDKRIGMAHPKIDFDGKTSDGSLMPLGCVGQINDCQKTADGRYILTLKGTQRFRIVRELPPHEEGFRQVEVEWLGPGELLTETTDSMPNRARMVSLAKRVLPDELSINEDAVRELTDAQLVDALCMHIPLPVWDKQALLDAAPGVERAHALLAVLETADAIKRSVQTSSHRH